MEKPFPCVSFYLPARGGAALRGPVRDASGSGIPGLRASGSSLAGGDIKHRQCEDDCKKL